MSLECKKIERLLWQYPDGDISKEDKADVELHLAQCTDCRQAFETIRLLKESSQATEESVDSIDAHVFDSAVMRKIEAQKRPDAVPVTPSKQYIIRMALSFAVAATLVIFMVKSISDLGKLPIPAEVLKESKSDTVQEHNYINIELSKNEETTIAKDNLAAGNLKGVAPAPAANAPTKKMEAPALSKAKSDATIALSGPVTGSGIVAPHAPSESTNVEAKQPNLTIAQAPQKITDQAMRTEAPMAPGILHSRGGQLFDKSISTIAAQSQSSYSILSKPVSQSSPDSINIGGVYLTADNIPLNVQSSAASLSEVISDTGSVQMGMPQSSRLVTIDKMPEVIYMATPEYPVWAKKRGLSGVVWIKAKINKDGNINEADVVSTSLKGAGFEDASIEAARQSKFHPAEVSGNPLEVWIIYPVKFIFKNSYTR